MPENTPETGNPVIAEDHSKPRSARIEVINRRILRRLMRLFSDKPEIQDILDENSITKPTEIVHTFPDKTPSGGLDMTKGWENVISTLYGEKSLKVRPPESSDILEESIYVSFGHAPSLQVRVTLRNNELHKYSNPLQAEKEARRILDRLTKQLRAQKKVLERMRRMP